MCVAVSSLVEWHTEVLMLVLRRVHSGRGVCCLVQSDLRWLEREIKSLEHRQRSWEVHVSVQDLPYNAEKYQCRRARNIEKTVATKKR